MKQLIFAALCLIFTNVRAQELPMENGKVVYEQIDSIPGSSKAEIFEKAKSWIINSYPSREKNIIRSSKDSGIMVSYGMTPFNIMHGTAGVYESFKSYYLIQVDCKDGKSRIRFYDIYIRTGYYTSKPIETWKVQGLGIDIGRKEQYRKVHIEVNNLMVINMASFKNAITPKSSASF